MSGENKFRFRDVIRTRWNPHPINPPTIDPDLINLDGLSRSAESIRYSILSLEFWLSKDGQVREWLRHNGRWALVLAIPAFCILPIITFALARVVAWVVALTAIAGQLIIFPILALLAAFVIYVVVQIVKAVFGR